MTGLDEMISLVTLGRDDDDADPSTYESNPWHDEEDSNGDGRAAAGPPPGDSERGSFDERFRSRRVDLFDRIEHGIPPLDFLPASARMFVRGKRHLLPAPKKTGKSLGMLVHWCDVILAGGRVVILDRENGADLYAGRLGLIVASRDLDDAQRAQLRACLVYYEFPKIRDYDRADLVSELGSADLVVFDSQRRFLTDLGLDENESDDFAKFMAAAIDPLFEAGIATLILDNTGHETSTRPRGSSAKEDLNEICFTLETIEHFSERRVGKIRLRLEPGRSRFGNEGTWDMTIGGGIFGGWDLVSLDDLEASEHQERHRDASTWILEYVEAHPGTAKTELVRAFSDHHGRGGRVLAEKVIGGALTGSAPALTKGPGKAPNGIYLYPASRASLQLPEGTTGSTGTTPPGPSGSESFPASPGLEGREAGSTSEGDPADGPPSITEDAS